MPFVDAGLLFIALGRLAVDLGDALRVEELEFWVWFLTNLIQWVDIKSIFIGPPTEGANAVDQMLVALIGEVRLPAKEHHTTLGDWPGELAIVYILLPFIFKASAQRRLTENCKIPQQAIRIRSSQPVGDIDMAKLCAQNRSQVDPLELVKGARLPHRMWILLPSHIQQKLWECLNE